MKALPRWLTSMTELPLPCQSSSSSRTCSRTSTGSVAGPEAKLYTRTGAYRLALRGRRSDIRRLGGDRVLLLSVEALDALDSDQPLAFPEADEAHALGVAALDRDPIDSGADQRAGGADEHDLLSRHDLQRRHREAVEIGR